MDWLLFSYYTYIIAKWEFLVNLFLSTKLVGTNLAFLVPVLTFEPILVLAEIFLLAVGQLLELLTFVTVLHPKLV
jgi:hypothetical protein